MRPSRAGGRARTRWLRAGLLGACAAAALAGSAQGQAQVRLRGAGDPDLDSWLLRFIAEGGYTLLTSDTTLAPGDAMTGPILVLRARFSIAGAVTGDVVAVDANVFVRPTGRIDGAVWNLGGGFYPSDLADITGRVRDHPLAPYRVDREGDLYVIVGLEHQGAFRPDGLYGLGLPTYDRVDGLSVPVGASWLLPALGRLRPTVGGRVVYRSERGEWDGGGFLELARGRTRLRLGAERATRTADRWIRGDFTNSFAFLAFGNDMRDYHRSDRYWARLELERSPGHWLVTPFLEARSEDARRLRAGDPWTLFESDDPVRPNRPVVAAAVASGLLGVDARWARAESALDFALEIEVGAPTGSGPISCAPDTCPMLDTAAVRALFVSEETFTGVTVDGSWVSPALRDHRLRARWHVQAPLGGDALPLRRWSHVGGPGTLPTLEDAERQGDRVILVETGYGVPIPVVVPLFGLPELELVHIFGGAWAAGGDDSLDQNIGLRVRTSLGWARVSTDPTDFGEDVVVDLGVDLPF